MLAARNVKATFFITGNNLGKGDIDSTAQWISVIQRMYAEGHQVASHSWSHQNLDSLNESARRYEMIRIEQALLAIIGKYPTYMRPPYIICGVQCKATMAALGYHVILWDLDTDDYNNDSVSLIQNSKNIVNTAIGEQWDAYMSIA